MSRKDFDRIVAHGCIVCRNLYGVVTPAMIHHATGIKYRATGKKAGDENVIALCHNHHQGEQGIHQIGMRPWEARYGTQEALIEQTRKLLA